VNAMLAYARAYRALGSTPSSADGALRALAGFWTTARDTLGKIPELRYGNNRALDLFRIANIILLTRALGGGRRPGAIPLDALDAALRASAGNGAAAALHRDLTGARGAPGDVVIALWKAGVQIQDALDYNEPPDWYYTLRESLGYAHLAKAEPDLAERVFSEDLVNNRGSGRSLHGLVASLVGQRKAAPGWLLEQLAAAWRHATVSAAP